MSSCVKVWLVFVITKNLNFFFPIFNYYLIFYFVFHTLSRQNLKKLLIIKHANKKFNLLFLEEILHEKARCFFSHAISECGNTVNEWSSDETLLEILVFVESGCWWYAENTNQAINLSKLSIAKLLKYAQIIFIVATCIL